MCFLRCGLLNSGTNQCLMNICSHACMFTQNLGSVEEYVSIQTLIWTTKYCLEFRAHIIVHLWKPWWQNMFTKLTLNYLIQIVQESICKTWPQIHAFIRLFVCSFVHFDFTDPEGVLVQFKYEGTFFALLPGTSGWILALGRAAVNAPKCIA